MDTLKPETPTSFLNAIATLMPSSHDWVFVVVVVVPNFCRLRDASAFTRAHSFLASRGMEFCYNFYLSPMALSHLYVETPCYCIIYLPESAICQQFFPLKNSYLVVGLNSMSTPEHEPAPQFLSDTSKEI